MAQPLSFIHGTTCLYQPHGVTSLSHVEGIQTPVTGLWMSADSTSSETLDGIVADICP